MGTSTSPLVLSQDPDYLDAPSLPDPQGLVAAPKTSMVDQQTSTLNPSKIHQNTGPLDKLTNSTKTYPNHTQLQTSNSLYPKLSLDSGAVWSIVFGKSGQQL